MAAVKQLEGEYSAFLRLRLLPMLGAIDEIDNLTTEVAPFDFGPTLFWMPSMRALRAHPKFKILASNFHMPEYWRVAGWPDFCEPQPDGDFTCH